MVSKNIVESFTNLNFESYINSTLTTIEISNLKNELHKHEKIEKEINDKLFKTFLINIDHLVDILEKNHLINKSLFDVEQDINEYEKIFNFFEEKHFHSFVDKEKQKELLDVLNLFDDDVKMFITDKRYLIYSDYLYLKDENDSKLHLLVFTNDLLIVGKKNDQKYVFKNAFNYNIMEIEIEDKKLKLKVDPLCFNFEKDVISVKKMFTVFKEIKFKNVQKEESEESSEESEEYDLFDYYIETEQYEMLEFYQAKKNINFDIEKIKSKENLFSCLKIIKNQKDQETFICEYLDFMLKEKIDKVGIAQNMDDLVKEIYKNFIDFYFICKLTFEEYWNEFKIKKSRKVSFVLFVESQIIFCFNLLKKRVFGKFGSIEEMENYLKNLKCDFIIDQFDYTYLLENFSNDIEKQNLAVIYEDKAKIDKLLDEMLSQNEQK